MLDGLVTYSSKVKRINRGYVTHYTIKLTLGIRTNYSNMIIVLRYNTVYLQLSMNYMRGLELLRDYSVLYSNVLSD